MKSLLKLLASLIFLALAIYQLDWPTLANAVDRLHLSFFIAAVLISLFQFVILSRRWHILVEELNGQSYVKNAAQYFCASFLNSFTPANLGGDAYRLWTLKQQNRSATSVLAILLRERLLGLFTYFLGYLLCLAILFSTHWELAVRSQTMLAGLGILLCLVCVALVFLGPMSSWLAARKWLESRLWLRRLLELVNQAVSLGPVSDLSKLLALSMIGLGVWVMVVLVVALNLGIDLPWYTLSMIVILVEILRLIPVSAQGIGVREGAYAYLFQALGQSSENGFVLAAVSYLALSISLLLSGLLGWAMEVSLRIKSED